MLNMTKSSGKCKSKSQDIYCFIPVRMAAIKKTSNKYWQGCGEKGNFVHSWWKCKFVQPLWKMAW